MIRYNWTDLSIADPTCFLLLTEPAEFIEILSCVGSYKGWPIDGVIFVSFLWKKQIFYVDGWMFLILVSIAEKKENI